MDIEKQVLSLPYARLLKELGVEQKSYFVWNEISGWAFRLSLASEAPDSRAVRYAAYTPDELFDILGSRVDGLRRRDDGTFCAYFGDSSYFAARSADALGRLLEAWLMKDKEKL